MRWSGILTSRVQEFAMADLIFIALGCAVFLAFAGYAALLRRV